MTLQGPIDIGHGGLLHPVRPAAPRESQQRDKDSRFPLIRSAQSRSVDYSKLPVLRTGDSRERIAHLVDFRSGSAGTHHCAAVKLDRSAIPTDWWAPGTRAPQASTRTRRSRGCDARLATARLPSPTFVSRPLSIVCEPCGRQGRRAGKPRAPARGAGKRGLWPSKKSTFSCHSSGFVLSLFFCRRGEHQVSNSVEPAPPAEFLAQPLSGLDEALLLRRHVRGEPSAGRTRGHAAPRRAAAKPASASLGAGRSPGNGAASP